MLSHALEWTQVSSISGSDTESDEDDDEGPSTSGRQHRQPVHNIPQAIFAGAGEEMASLACVMVHHGYNAL